jgi:AraC-like DNA-binding protein
VENKIYIKKIYPKATLLKHLIKYFWVFECPQANLFHKLLPVNNIDIVFNLLSPIVFIKKGNTVETPGNIFFRGLTKKHIKMKQQGTILTIGASFFPVGFYPFFRIPISEFKNETFDLDTILKNGVYEIEAKLMDTDTISKKIALLENFFLDLLDQNALLSPYTSRLLIRFSSSNLSINDFCLRNGVHSRTFERLFNKYIGTTPKTFSRLSRFQIILNKLINRQETNLTTLANEFDFFDQPHFIKDFQSLTGSAPLKFIKEKQSIKQISTNN